MTEPQASGHDAYPDPVAGGWDGYEAACHDCDWRSGRVTTKDEARAHAAAHEEAHMPRERSLGGDLFGDRGAVLSDCGVYRYRLWRAWGPGPRALFVMLNPSTADADVDDPTIRRCIGFARRWGYDGIEVWNLYAFRATDPSELDAAPDPIGRDNEDWLWKILQSDPAPGCIVAAWGAKPGRGRYTARETSILYGPLYEREILALGTTKDGHPRHPLYVRGDSEPVVFSAPGEARRAA